MAKSLSVGPEGLLSAILRDQPSRRGAACVRAPHLFDPQADDEIADDAHARHVQAASICATCPALLACAEHIPDDRAVYAGQLPALQITTKPHAAA